MNKLSKFLFIVLLMLACTPVFARVVTFTNKTKHKIYISYACHTNGAGQPLKASITGWYAVKKKSSIDIDVQIPAGKHTFYLYAIQKQKAQKDSKKLDAEPAMEWPRVTMGAYMFPVKHSFQESDEKYNLVYNESTERLGNGKPLSKPAKAFYKVSLKKVAESAPVEIIFKDSPYLWTKPGNVGVKL